MDTGAVCLQIANPLTEPDLTNAWIAKLRTGFLYITRYVINSHGNRTRPCYCACSYCWLISGRQAISSSPQRTTFKWRVVEIGRFIQSALSRRSGIKKPNSFAKYVIASGLSGNHCKHVNSTHLLVVQRHLVVLAWFFYLAIPAVLTYALLHIYA